MNKRVNDFNALTYGPEQLLDTVVGQTHKVTLMPPRAGPFLKICAKFKFGSFGGFPLTLCNIQEIIFLGL